MNLLFSEPESELHRKYIRQAERARLYWTDYALHAPANKMTFQLFKYLWLNTFFPAFQIAQMMRAKQSTVEKRLREAHVIQDHCEFTQRFMKRNCKAGV